MIIAYLWVFILNLVVVDKVAFAIFDCSEPFASEQSSSASWLEGIHRVVFNTSTDSKYNVFRHILPIPIERNNADILEIDADHYLVIAHKASQFEPKPGEIILVEDSALQVDGADIGVHVKFRKHLLQQYIGRSARWDVLLAYRKGDEVLIFRGSVEGVIKNPEDGIGNFDGYFAPLQSSGNEGTPIERDQLARYIAVDALMKHQVHLRLPVIKNWQGSFQNLNAD